MNTSWKLAALTGSVLCTALLISSASFADEPSARETDVWQKHEYSFAFLGFTSTYSCDGLADKLKLLLLAAGARHNVKSRAGACASGLQSAGIPPLPRLTIEIKLALLVRSECFCHHSGSVKSGAW